MDLLTGEAIMTVLKIIVAVVFVLFIVGCGLFVLAMIGAGIAEQEGYRPSEREGGTHADTEGI